MPVGINIPVNTATIDSLAVRLKSATRDVQILNKQLTQAIKDGKNVEAISDKLAKAEAHRDTIKTRLATDARRMKFEEELQADEGIGGKLKAPHFRSAHFGPFRFSIQEKAEHYANVLAQRPGIKSALMQQFGGENSAMGKTFLEGGVGAVARSVAQKIIPYAGAAAGLAALPMAISAIMATGNPYSEERRKFDADYEMQMSDAKLVDPGRREIIQRQGEKYNRDKTYWGHTWTGTIATLGISNLMHAWNARADGIDAYSMAKLERTQAIRESGFAHDLNQVSSLAETRNYADYYGSASIGFIMQNTWGKFKNIWGSNADAEEATKNVSESVKRFKKFADEGDLRAMSGNLEGANIAYEQAAKEDGRSQNWRDPMSIYMANEQANKSAIAYAINMNPLPPLRRGF